jgi:hypothetical protein
MFASRLKKADAGITSAKAHLEKAVGFAASASTETRVGSAPWRSPLWDNSLSIFKNMLENLGALEKAIELDALYALPHFAAVRDKLLDSCHNSCDFAKEVFVWESDVRCSPSTRLTFHTPEFDKLSDEAIQQAAQQQYQTGGGMQNEDVFPHVAVCVVKLTRLHELLNDLKVQMLTHKDASA